MRRFLALAVALAAFAVAPIGATPVTTAATSPTIPFHARIGNILGMIPPAELAAGQSNGAVSNSAPTSGHLSYNGGPVMATNTVYTIYWQPDGYAFPSGYSSAMDTYFRDVAADSGKNTNTYDVATQYYEKGQYVQYKSTFGGSVLDQNALPPLDPVNCPDTPVAATNGGASAPSTAAGCVTDQQVQEEISRVIKQQGWPVSNQTEFFMFTAPNIGTCFPATVGVDTGAGVQTTVTAPLCSFSYFCAYHSAYSDTTINANSQIIYSNMPYAAQTAGNPLTCDVQSYPNGSPADPEINVTSHEHNESITDPFGNGWWDSNPNDAGYGYENGDMCAWDFGNTYGDTGSEYSQTINGHHYLMQTEWDNSTNGCPGSDSSGNAVPSEPNYATPSISLTPNIGYPTAPFKIVGRFFAAGERASSSFVDAGTTTALGTSTASSSGRIVFKTAVPTGAKAGTATVHTGSATADFTVPR